MNHRVLLVVAGLAAACNEDPGDLDPERAREITLTEGDARGNTWSGHYQALIEAEACGCELETTPPWASLCGNLALQAGGRQSFSFWLSQSGGQMLMRVDSLPMESAISLTGPVYEDGLFTLASITHSPSFYDEARVITRIDGNLDDNAVLEATVRHRLLGEFVLSDAVRDLDCTEVFLLSGAR